MRCGSCLQGCPTNAGKSTLNTYIHPPWADGRLELMADCDVRRVLLEDRGKGAEASGVE
jgi:GMC oxidoreductase